MLESDHGHLREIFDTHKTAFSKLETNVVAHDRFIERQRGVFMFLSVTGLANLVAILAILVKLFKG